MSQFIVLLAISFVILTGCGSNESELQNSPELSFQFIDQYGAEWTPAAATTTTELPVTLLITLVGPNGSVSQEVAYETHELALKDMEVGAWSARGDGMDDSGNVRWVAQPVGFKIVAEKATKISLVFRPL